MEKKVFNENYNNNLPYGLNDVEDPELNVTRKNVWKQFGRETEAGKLLFSLYKSH